MFLPNLSVARIGSIPVDSTYVVLYRFSPSWWFLLVGIAGIGLGASIALRARTWRYKAMGAGISVFFGIYFMLGIGICVDGFRQVARLSSLDGVQVVEGVVENFEPGPAEGHKSEAFDVKGVRFEYSDFIQYNAYNTSISHGGVIRPGIRVRILYVPRENRNDIILIEAPE